MYYALIGWGGTQIGIRPRTRLARIDGKKVATWNGKAWIACRTRTADITEYARWRGMPSPQQIANVRKRLQPVVCEHVIRNIHTGTCCLCGEPSPERDEAVSWAGSHTPII